MQEPIAIITGAGRGIGRATAIALSQRNYQVALLARSAADLHETRNQCGGGLVLPVDVTDAAAVQAAIETVQREFGRIDAVVHCAGLAPVRSIVEMSVQEWHAVLDTNLSAAFYLCKAAWPVFVRQGGGVVVNVSSAAARDPFGGFAAYSAAKAGVNLFGLSAAREGRESNIRVHTIAPAAVETAMFRQILTAEQYPPDKTLSPEDVAKMIVQCVIGDLRHSNGEVMYVHKEI